MEATNSKLTAIENIVKYASSQISQLCGKNVSVLVIPEGEIPDTLQKIKCILLIDAILEHLKIDKMIFFSKNSKRIYVDTRKMITMILLRHFREFSFNEIAGLIGGLDHSSITHYRKTFLELYDNDKWYRKDYDKLCEWVETTQQHLLSVGINRQHRVVLEGKG